MPAAPGIFGISAASWRRSSAGSTFGVCWGGAMDGGSGTPSVVVGPVLTTASSSASSCVSTGEPSSRTISTWLKPVPFSVLIRRFAIPDTALLTTNLMSLESSSSEAAPL